MRPRLFTAYPAMSNSDGACDARAAVAGLRPKLLPKEGARSAKGKAEVRS